MRWFHDMVDRVPVLSSGRQYHLSLCGKACWRAVLCLWQHHASLAKQLQPQLHHLGVSARERICNLFVDKILHCLIAALSLSLYACLILCKFASDDT